MRRSIEQELKKWKDAPTRYPLLLRGARQVGKTYIIEKLGREEFESFEIVNFEAQPEAMACFESLDPIEIVQRLELVLKRPIFPGKTLLFLDEIQACPQAIVALRYFKEKMPLLHVIGAGSLLEFSLIQGKYSFPVGRVQFIYMRPLSFHEFALASHHENTLEQLQTTSLKDPVVSELHQQLVQLVKEYFLTGGMPAVLEEFIVHRSFLTTGRIQELLLSTYRADFNKYATEAEQRHLRILFDGIPHQVSQHFKYSKIDPQLRSRELKVALDQLQWAGLIHLIFATAGSGIPLAAQMQHTKIKPLFLDIGLLQSALQVDPQLVWTQDLIQIHNGALAEQFVGQELLAYTDFFREQQLFYWEREKQTSDAQVDYLITIDQHIIPIEVKAGATGHLKSLRVFMEEKKSILGIRISQHPLSYKDQILSVPFYMIEQIPRLVREIIA